MNAWNQPQAAPQLEQEYSLDPNVYDIQANPNQRYGQRPGMPASSHVPNFTPFPQTFGPGAQSTFNFPTGQNQTANQQFDNNAYYQSSLSDLRGQHAFPTQGSHFGGSPSSIQSSSILPGHGLYQNTSPPGGYGQGHSDAPIFDGSPGSAASGVPTSNVYVPSNAPLSQHYSLNQVDTKMAPPIAQGSSYFPSDRGETSAKRPRADEHGQHESEGTDSRSEPVRKTPGACARCKGLKVRCEFKTDPDTCKRCLNAGAECVIPGRKKRRAPPKRELLLKQIQSQADQIKTLMTQLDEANRKVDVTSHISNAPSPATASTDLHSSLPSDFTSPDSEYGLLSPSLDQVAKPDVLDWIQKARESLEEFGGYINATTGLFSNDGSVVGDNYDIDDDIAIDIEDVDADDNGTLMDEGEIDYDISGDEGSNMGGNRRHMRNVSGDASKRGVATLPTTAAPFGLMARLALEMPRKRRPSNGASDVAEEEPDDDDTLPNNNYFVPAAAPDRPLIDDRHEPPHILRKGIVTPAEVESLFKIYWDHMNISLNILDPDLYTPQKTYWRSPFLFTVICAVASRFYTPRPELYQQAMHFARLAAGTALIGGRKSVEVVQAYLILAMNPVPCRRWEDDRSWVFLGLAIRIATAINLHLPFTTKPRNEQHAREMLNRTRTWLACFNLDRSFGSQYGKPPIINNTDYTANHCAEWWHSSPYNLPNFDIHIACYSNELRVMADFGLKIRSDRNNPTGFNKSLDIPKLAAETDDELIRLWETWSALLEKHTDLNEQRCNFRRGLLRLAFTYARLTALSLGFQFGRKPDGDDVMLWRCLRVAKEVAKTYVDDIGIPEQRIYLRHGPDSQSVFVTFACTFLIKLLQPKYAGYLPIHERGEIRELVRRVADLLGSSDVTVDDRHYPKLYSRFLKGLLETPMAKDDPPISVNRQNAKALSESPATSARPSASPPPQEPAVDHFSQQLAAGLDPYSSALFQGGSGLNVPEYFNPPLPFEPEMIQSMQSLTDPALYHDVMSGFSWMGEMHQNDSDMNLHYDPRTYGAA
ncbi:unnamed protein product [Somion occarium]|uniref:Zn(2)-C6 fungal-type domain-containing protein n=1 Tax=Somion occarium TaxID=3059160 RepID=A0ABP1EAR2_9APHY